MKDLETHYVGKTGSAPDEGPNWKSLVLSALCYFAVLAACFLCSSCKTKTVIQEVPVLVHDTLVQRQLRIDSVAWRDTVRIEKEVRGDTVFLREYISRWRPEYHWLTDTCYVSKEVPVEVTKTVTKEVPAKLSRWQRLRITLGSIVLLLALGFGLFKIFSFWRKLK